LRLNAGFADLHARKEAFKEAEERAEHAKGLPVKCTKKQDIAAG